MRHFYFEDLEEHIGGRGQPSPSGVAGAIALLLLFIFAAASCQMKWEPAAPPPTHHYEITSITIRP